MKKEYDLKKLKKRPGPVKPTRMRQSFRSRFG